MKRALLTGLVLPLAIAYPALAQDHSQHGARAPNAAPKPVPKPAPKPAAQAVVDPHAGHTMPAAAPDPHAGNVMPATAAGAVHQTAMTGADQSVGSATPPPAPADRAADRFFHPAAMERARGVLRQEHGGARTSKFMIDLFEYKARAGDDGYRWEGEAWWGGDLNRVVVKTEGEGTVGDEVDAAEVQALYSRAVGRYTDLQVGLRHDVEPGPSRTYLTVGAEALLPYWFEAEGAVFLSQDGDFLARIEGSYDLRLTQRLTLQPRAELNFSAQDIIETRTGSGLSQAELGLRLRYEIRREFAPYIGVNYERSYGGTADFARALGDDVGETSVVVGLRAWF